MTRGNAGGKRISRELYEECAPVYQAGVRARAELASRGGDMDRSERVRLNRLASAGDAAFERFCASVDFLVTRLIRDEMEKPRAFHCIIEEDDLRIAAMEGIQRMLLKVDTGKMESAVNYLIQWVGTMVRRAAERQEASYGLPPTRMRLFKKIQAVRRKLRDELGVEPTDEQVLEFFHSGRADRHTKFGRKASDKPRIGSGGGTSVVKENASLTIEQVRAQREFMYGHPFNRVVPEEDVDREVHDDSAEVAVMTEDDRVRESFWFAFFLSRGIIRKQWEPIAVAADLFTVEDTGARYKVGDMTRLRADFDAFLASPDAMLGQFARMWRDGRGADVTAGERALLAVPGPDGRMSDMGSYPPAAHGEGYWDAFCADGVVDRQRSMLAALADDAAMDGPAMPWVDVRGSERFSMLRFDPKLSGLRVRPESVR